MSVSTAENYQSKIHLIYIPFVGLGKIEYRGNSWYEYRANLFEKYVLKSLAKKSDTFTVACDYDGEGSLIGYNIVRFIRNQKDGKRIQI